MRLSTKSRYGMRILAQIAIDCQNAPSVKGKVIAKRQEISEPYLEQIMIPLKNSGFVRTIRGCNGGYVLNAKPEDITTLAVIEMFEGEIDFVHCSDCKRKEFCETCNVWRRLSVVFKEEAAKITLADIIKDIQSKNRPEYMI